MATTILTTAEPETKTSGNWPYSTMDAGSWHFDFAPTAADTNAAYTGSSFYALFAANDDGGVWLTSKKVQLFNASSGALIAASSALTWSAGQSISVTIRIASGTNASKIIISGATTGNGTTSFTIGTAHIFTNVTLGIGVYGGGGFGFTGSLSNVDDASGTTITADPGSMAITGTAATLKATRKIAAAADSVALTGTAANLTYSPVIPSTYTITASAGSMAITGTAASFRFNHALAAASGSMAITGTDAALTSAGAISLGAHGVDFQVYGHASRDALVTLNTQSGSLIIVAAGGKTSDVDQAVTDTNSNTWGHIAATQDYPNYPGYGVSLSRTKGAVVGGSSHGFTVQVSLFDENTTFAIQVIGAKRVAGYSWKNIANGSGGTSNTSDPVTAYKPCYWLAFWWGSGPVFSPNTTPFTAVPDGSFVVLDSYLVNNSDGEVQAAMAGFVDNTPSIASPVTRTVTWANTPSQGAQLILLALQTADILTADAESVAVTGTAATLRVGHRMSAAAGSFVITGTDVTFRLGHTVTAVAGSIAITGTAAAVRVARRLTADPGTTGITGTAAGLQLGHVAVAQAGTIAITGAAAGLRTARQIAAAAGSMAVTGTAASLTRGRPLAADSGAVTIAGTDARVSAGKVLAAGAGAMSITGTAAGVAAGHRLIAAAGSVAVTGTAAGLARGARAVAAAGAIAVSGTAAALAATRRVTAASGAVVIVGTAAGLRRSYSLSAAAGAVSVAGTAASVRAARTLASAAGSVAITGSAAELTRATSNTVVASPGVYAVTGSSAALRVGRRIAAGDGAFVVLVAGPAAVLHVERKISPAAGAFVTAGTSATLRYSHSIAGIPARVQIVRTTAALGMARTTRAVGFTRTTQTTATRRTT